MFEFDPLTARYCDVSESLDTVAPTIGFTSLNFNFDDYMITMFDLGGGKKIRDIWKNYFAEVICSKNHPKEPNMQILCYFCIYQFVLTILKVYGLIYVVDSTAGERMEECRSVLEHVLSDKRMRGKPTLV